MPPNGVSMTRTSATWGKSPIDGETGHTISTRLVAEHNLISPGTLTGILTGILTQRVREVHRSSILTREKRKRQDCAYKQRPGRGLESRLQMPSEGARSVAHPQHGTRCTSRPSAEDNPREQIDPWHTVNPYQSQRP